MRAVLHRSTACSLMFVSALLLSATPVASEQFATLPNRLTDAEFWKLVTDISEPGGYFRIADNFTSNEMEIAQVAGTLRDQKRTGGAYVGVGPEQNFTYIAAIKPDVAFIIDIRRQAVIQHLMFKAIFELSKDRADFVSLLFSKRRPAQLDTNSNVAALWEAFTPVATDTALARANFQRISDHLVRTHHFALTSEETGMLRWVWDAFTMYGPGISTSVGQGPGRGGAGRGTFATLTGYSLDESGNAFSFLSTEANYRFVKSLHERNMFIPVSGDFAGPKALRAIGAWLTGQGTKVRAYYLSNVEQYLFQDNKQAAFYANAATLPLDSTSVFIRPYSLRRGFGGGFGGNYNGPAVPLCPMQPYLKSFDQQRATAYNDALACMQ